MASSMINTYLSDGRADGGRMAGGRRTDSGRTADGQRTTDRWLRTDGRRTADGQRSDGGRTADGRRRVGGRTPDGGQVADARRAADGIAPAAFPFFNRLQLPNIAHIYTYTYVYIYIYIRGLPSRRGNVARTFSCMAHPVTELWHRTPSWSIMEHHRHHNRGVYHGASFSGAHHGQSRRRCT